MACKECGHKVASNRDDIYVKKNKTRFWKKTVVTIMLAILMNGILIVSSYNYVQYLVYKESIQVIKLENYKNEQINIEQNNTRLQNMSRSVYRE